ncbi:B box-type domain-containing protein [Schizosaccharomyces pombe]
MSIAQLFNQSWVEKSKYVPVRLSDEERKILSLLEAALEVIDYTGHVDIISYTTRTKLMVKYLNEMCSIVMGLVTAMDIKAGRDLLIGRDHKSNARFFQTVFEIGRRYKIMNPEKMRATYGAVMYMCQDSLIPDVRSQLGFDFVSPIKTVYNVLEKHELLSLLEEKQLLNNLLKQSDPQSNANAKAELLKEREEASETLLKKYNPGKDEKLQKVLTDCFASLADHEAFLLANRNPVEKMRAYLHKFFNPHDTKNGSLKIGYMTGAKLNHDHKTQFFYVDQSLVFWSCMMDQMFLLWLESDASLLDKHSRYFISDTGQGLNRVQLCPLVRSTVTRILSSVQKQQEIPWMGSSVIHLGDRDVPNALMFIDKYRQVPHILAPLVKVLQQLEFLRDPYLVQYIENEYGSVNGLQKTILLDFFRHGFNGQGSDGGSCIDGRLTSAWNWTNEITKKKYYRILLMSGFLNFEGI